MHGWTDEWMHGWMHAWMDGWVDRPGWTMYHVWGPDAAVREKPQLCSALVQEPVRLSLVQSLASCGRVRMRNSSVSMQVATPYSFEACSHIPMTIQGSPMGCLANLSLSYRCSGASEDRRLPASKGPFLSTERTAEDLFLNGRTMCRFAVGRQELKTAIRLYM